MENNSSFGIKFIDPQAVIAQTDIQKGMTVADFGCGTGYFSLPLSRLIGEEGVIYSLDILPQRLESVASQAKNFGLTNIITKRVNLEKENGSTLADKSVDWVILKDILFQNKEKKLILTEAKRVVRDGGKVLIVEWKPEDSSIGPEKELRISKEALISIAQQCGLGVFKEIGAGNFHYGLILIK